MANPVVSGRGLVDCPAVADQFAAVMQDMLGYLQAWRDSININGTVSGLEAQDNYSRIVGLRSWVQAHLLSLSPADISGVTQAYQHKYTAASGFNPSTDWPPANAAITSFATWFQNNWLQRSPQGNPAFTGYNSSGEFISLILTLTAPQKTALLAQLDGILSSFT